MKSFAKNLFLFGTTSLIIFFVLDLFIQASFIETKSPTDFVDDYGRCRKKNMDYVFFNEGFSMGRFNEGRYVNSYYPPKKPDDVIRIAALGDSYVEGFQVFERNHFLKLTENELNRKLEDRVQVLNFGRSGFDFGDMYAYYETMVKQYNCDYVMFFVSNADLNIEQTDKLIPKVVELESDLIVTDSLMPESYLRLFKELLPLSHISVVYQMLNNSIKLVSAGKLPNKLFDKFSKSKGNSPDNAMFDLRYDDHASTIARIFMKLEEIDSKVIIVNRDFNKLSNKFVDAIPTKIEYIDIVLDSELYKGNEDPHFWKVTSKRGHWNLNSHQNVSEFLANYFQDIYN